MSERCLHCAILNLIADHADAKAPAGDESRVDVIEAMYALGAVWRQIMDQVPVDRRVEAATVFASGTAPRSEAAASPGGLH